MSEKFNIELFPCDSGVGSSFNESDNISNYEYDLQHIPLTLCNLKFGLEDRLESINDSVNEFSNQIDGAQEKFKSCDTKLKYIKIFQALIFAYFRSAVDFCSMSILTKL